MSRSSPPVPHDWRAQRDALQRVAAHVMARRRHDVTGRFGLRATPAGFGTPAFGDGHEVVRAVPAGLLLERDGRARLLPWTGATLASCAAHVGVDLDAPLDLGHDTPALGDVASELEIDGAAVAFAGGFYDLTWRALDRVVGAVADASMVQLWPEHFDAALDVAYTADRRVNLGGSPGDPSHAEPYLYVGPWGSERPGDPAFWSAPFGAVLDHSALHRSDDPVAAAVAFFERGLTLLRAPTAGSA